MPISSYLVLSAMLFLIGVMGVLFRRNALIMFMSIELMLNSVNLSFVAFARLWNAADGHMFVMFILTVAAAEAAVEVVIDHPDGLHQCVERSRTDEGEPAPPQLASEGAGLLRHGGHVAQRPRRRRGRRSERPEERIEPSLGTERERGLRVGPRRLDLLAVAHDAGVAHQPLDVGIGERGDGLRLEATEGGVKRRPLPEDRDP